MIQRYGKTFYDILFILSLSYIYIIEKVTDLSMFLGETQLHEKYMADYTIEKHKCI